ncbi:hypothetical protein HDU97_003149 [Phlyctochytrium planicorne]|nr:hypothetical protein HDU97_003149 [Phlyctochytrium planicorne]
MPSIFTSNAVAPEAIESQPNTANVDDVLGAKNDPISDKVALLTAPNADIQSPTTDAGTPSIISPGNQNNEEESAERQQERVNSQQPENNQQQQHQLADDDLSQHENENNDDSQSSIPNQDASSTSAPVVIDEPVAESAAAKPAAAAIEAPNFVRIQLIPFAEPPNKVVPGLEMAERRLKEGIVVRIGRLVVKDGQTQPPKPRKNAEADIWYTSKVVSRTHAEMWVKDGQIFIKDIGSSSGTFLNKMRLSPSGKESRPYPIKENDVLQFGVDYKGKTEDMFKCVNVKVGFYDQSWVKQSRKNANPVRFRAALKSLLAASNPYGSSNGTSGAKDTDEDDPTATECCICIGSVAPMQAIFLAPCSHCFHFKCVASIIAQSAMFQCPLCRQVANLAASVSMDSLNEDEDDDNDEEDEKETSGEGGSLVDAESATHERHRTEVARADPGLDVDELHGEGHHTAKPSVAHRNHDTSDDAGPSTTEGSSHPSNAVNNLRNSVSHGERPRSGSFRNSMSKKGKGADNANDSSSEVAGSPSTSKSGPGRRTSISAKIGDMFKHMHINKHGKEAKGSGNAVDEGANNEE